MKLILALALVLFAIQLKMAESATTAAATTAAATTAAATTAAATTTVAATTLGSGSTTLAANIILMVSTALIALKNW